MSVKLVSKISNYAEPTQFIPNEALKELGTIDISLLVSADNHKYLKVMTATDVCIVSVNDLLESLKLLSKTVETSK